VAIETNGAVQYKSGRIPNPDRLYFDLKGAKPDLGGKGVQQVGDKFLKRVRVAETVPGVTRVVLDLEKDVTFTSSQVINPDRLMIELHGRSDSQPPALVAVAAPTTENSPQSQSPPQPAPSMDQRPANQDQVPQVSAPPNNENFLRKLQNPYQPREVSAVDFRNSGRIGKLIRAGNLYLSLQDAIDLAVENNLDLQLQRFNPRFAEADVLRAKGGGVLRGVDFNIRNLPQGIGGPGSPLLTTVGGTSPITTVASNSADLAPLQETVTNLSVTGAFPYATGPVIPQYDPSINWLLQGSHTTTFETNLNSYGVNPLASSVFLGTAGYTQGFATGTTINASFDETRTTTNAANSNYNPFTTGYASISLTQHLLQGFGRDNNRRFIRIAENTQKISAEVFRQQVIETLWSVARLYFDLVSLNEDVRVKRQALDAARKLYDDNKSQVEVGTLAPIEVKRAQAEVARTQEDLINSTNLVLQQELILKNVLTRQGTKDPLIGSSRIIPLDAIEQPKDAPAVAAGELVGTAMQSRPDLAQAALQIQNTEISLKGSKNALLPSLDFIANFQNNGYVGQINPLALPLGAVTSPAIQPGLLGGGATLLSQVFGKNYPNYAVGLQLNVTLRNRVAQADVIRDELQLRQSEVRKQQLENEVRLEVENALLNVQRAMASYRAAQETRELQEEALDAEQQRYQVGASTTYLVIQYQRDLAQARSTEVVALGNYAKAKAALDRATGTNLDTYHVSIDEALKGMVSRAPSELPPGK
jgi:outer membrane protein TolC